MRNLVLIHRESLNWQKLAAFADAMPNLMGFMRAARVYRSYFSSATSTQMVLAALYHGNDFELDRMPGLSSPAANNPSLAAALSAHGYETAFLCVTARPDRVMFRSLGDTLPPVWSTNDFEALRQKFEALIARPRFAIHVCDLSTHIEHAARLAPLAQGTGDLVAGMLDAADRSLGQLLAALDRQGVAEDTVVVVYGDHGDDFFTHGLNAGLVHGVEPYSPIVHVPLAIRATSLGVGSDERLASTVDLAPTLAELIGLPIVIPFVPSGASLLRGERHDAVFSQNFTANQPDDRAAGAAKGFAASDRTHTLLVGARGLRLFNHRLDPSNHTNLLHFFDVGGDGRLVRRSLVGPFHAHFEAGLLHLLGSAGATEAKFDKLRAALRAHVAQKNAHVAEWAMPTGATLRLSAFDRADRSGERAFYGLHGHGPSARLGRLSLRLRRSWAGIRLVSFGHRLARLARRLGYRTE